MNPHIHFTQQGVSHGQDQISLVVELAVRVWWEVDSTYDRALLQRTKRKRQINLDRWCKRQGAHLYCTNDLVAQVRVLPITTRFDENQRIRYTTNFQKGTSRLLMILGSVVSCCWQREINGNSNQVGSGCRQLSQDSTTWKASNERKRGNRRDSAGQTRKSHTNSYGIRETNVVVVETHI